MADHWELMDVYKALLAIAGGIVLGLEREMKDKVAGLKTITIICLGAALFSIISFKTGEELGVDNTAIAAYIVSGVGFIGAGAIFKDGFTISGLTTAGIIWLAAAVGMAIGFGEFFLAGTFIAGSLIVVFIAPVFNNLFKAKNISKQLVIVLQDSDISVASAFVEALHRKGIFAERKKVLYKEGRLEISYDLSLKKELLEWLEDILIKQEKLISFSIS